LICDEKNCFCDIGNRLKTRNIDILKIEFCLEEQNLSGVQMISSKLIAFFTKLFHLWNDNLFGLFNKFKSFKGFFLSPHFFQRKIKSTLLDIRESKQVKIDDYRSLRRQNILIK